MKLTKNYLSKTFVRKKYAELLPKFKEERLQAVTTISLTFIAITLFGFFAISPTLSTIAQLNKKLKDNQSVYTKLKEKNANLSTLQQKYTLILNDVPVILNAFPQNPSISLLLGQIQFLVKSHNLMLSKLQSAEVLLTKDDDKPLGYSMFGFSVSVEGKSQDILDLITSLIKFERITTIENVSIVTNPKIPDLYQTNISARGYFKK